MGEAVQARPGETGAARTLDVVRSARCFAREERHALPWLRWDHTARDPGTSQGNRRGLLVPECMRPPWVSAAPWGTGPENTVLQLASRTRWPAGRLRDRHRRHLSSSVLAQTPCGRGQECVFAGLSRTPKSWGQGSSHTLFLCFLPKRGQAKYKA